MFLTLPNDPAELARRIGDMQADAARLGREIKVLSYAFVLCRDTEAEALRVRDQIIAAVGC